ncbi:GAF domain-containing protein [Salinilacihabitans rarus]|uniref:GAF domain-containing protein n=1 Tax=Salinilacihabitans rarus TaxID=2961596 RepID=UPI0020C91158|nr:GAF domain-containing protein [Salinilacihabitans rarus]
MAEQTLEGGVGDRRSDDELTVLLVARSSAAEALEAGLRREVGRVVSVSSTDDAVVALEESSVDCVVSESDLDDGDGRAFLERIRDRYPSLPVVPWTADGDGAAASDVRVVDAPDYVTRDERPPTEFESLANRIRRAVDSGTAERDPNRRNLNTVSDLNQRLARADTIEEGLHVVLTDVCELTAWEYSEIWVPNSRRDELEHAKSYALNDSFREFVEVTRTTGFRKGEGLPGRVWATEDTEWIRDVSSLSPDKYIRTEIAASSNLKAAFGIPVKSAGRVEAVLAYYLTRPRAFDDDIAAVVETLAATFGSLIATELVRRPTNERLTERYEAPVRRLKAARTGIRTASTASDVARPVVDLAAETLNAAHCVAYLYDDRGAELVPAAVPEALDVRLEEFPRVSPGENAVWRSFVDGTATRLEGDDVADELAASGATVRRQLIVPLDDRGALVVGDPDPEVGDGFRVETVKAACDLAGAALARHLSEAELGRRSRELETLEDRLERSRRVVEGVQNAVAAVCEADSRPAISRAICTSLLSLRPVDGAWIGVPDPERNELRVAHHVGTPEAYLEGVPLALSEDNTLPAARAAAEREAVVEADTAGRPGEAGWRRTALLYEFRSLASVPIYHGGVLYGVLTAISTEPEGFDATVRDSLVELGSLVGHAFAAADRQDALLADETTTLTVEVTGARDPFARLASRFDAEVVIENVTRRSDGGYLVHFVVDDGDADEVATTLGEEASVRHSRVVCDSSSPRLEAVVGDCIVTSVAGLGAAVCEVTVSTRGIRIDLSIPRQWNKQEFTSRLRELYPDVRLRAYATPPRSGSSSAPPSDERLTDRQHEILEAAYRGGYFDQPRKSTGEEIAESLGISQPAFSTQLRAIQRKLVESIHRDERR